MILEYLWIKKFRVLENIGFNFSSEKAFSYDNESKKLTKNDNRKFIPGFFGPNFSAVTAVIGENGVGKSTLFEFIIRNLASFGNGSSVDYKDDHFIAIFTNIILTSDLELIKNIDDFIKSGYTIEVSRKPNTFLNLVGKGYENTAYVYYSNVFDYKRDYEDPINLIDLSTNHLISEDSLSSDKQIKLYNFVFAEIKRQIDFLSEIDYKVPFQLPNILTIEIPNEVYKYKHLIGEKELNELGLNSITGLDSEFDSQSPHEKIKYLIYVSLLKYRSYNNPELYKELKIETFQSFFTSNFEIDKDLTSKIKSEFLLIKDVFVKYDLVSNAQQISVKREIEGAFNYTISDTNKLFYDFMNSINSLLGLDFFLRFSWHSISSGEKAFLALLARLNQGKKQLKDRFEFDIKRIIVLIDEFDLYMHPEWQREFFNVVHSQLPKIFKDIDIQLILSSHSPFIVSDLPKSNIIFLNKENNRCINIDPEKMEETFGQNIHTLFTNSFFLQKGLLGEFASQKINQLIKFINGEASIIESDEEAQKIINIIGEPIVQNKLQLMLNDKRSDELNIEWHTNQIAMLKEKQKRNLK